MMMDKEQANPADADDGRVMDIGVFRNPESGLCTARVSGPHPMIVKAYGLADVFKAIWDRLAAENALGRFASNVVVDFTYRELREDNNSLHAQVAAFSRALSQINHPDHPLGSPTSLAEARELTDLAFTRVRQVEFERRRAWRNGALAQTEARTDRDLLDALCGAVNDALALLATKPAQQDEGLQFAIDRLKAVLAACSVGDERSL